MKPLRRRVLLKICHCDEQIACVNVLACRQSNLFYI
jgi:hypothetical protein